MAQQSHSVETLRWMTGCWRQVTVAPSKRVIDEQWMAPLGKTMLGMGRTVRGDTLLVEFEHLQILERGAALIYHAEPSGQTPADFTATFASDTSVTFENPKHDFPQRITYRHAGADALTARVAGTMNGKERAIEFSYHRVSCEKD
jgi:hypothetical protein